MFVWEILEMLHEILVTLQSVRHKKSYKCVLAYPGNLCAAILHSQDAKWRSWLEETRTVKREGKHLGDKPKESWKMIIIDLNFVPPEPQLSWPCWTWNVQWTLFIDDTARDTSLWISKALATHLLRQWISQKNDTKNEKYQRTKLAKWSGRKSWNHRNNL